MSLLADIAHRGRRIQPAATDPRPSPTGLLVRVVTALACGLLGLALVVQVRSSEELGTRLDVQREEDLARILSDLSGQSDRLQEEITDLRLTLLAFESSAGRDEVALRTLQQRLDDLRILAGAVAATGQGIVLTIDDPAGQMTQERLVDTLQELRAAGAEVIAVNGTRLVASSAVVERDGQLLLDGAGLSAPYEVAAIGPPETIAEALNIPGGAVDALEALSGVRTVVRLRTDLTLPPRGEPVEFVHGEPVAAQSG
jgi:uncharacterized protein YlxW (UPF0749 family)